MLAAARALGELGVVDGARLLPLSEACSLLTKGETASTRASAVVAALQDAREAATSAGDALARRLLIERIAVTLISR